MRTDHQASNYRAFMKSVEDAKVKVQIGARGQKRGPDWVAADLYDIDPIIDANWDLHCIPVADKSVDCYVCNAVLEHVTDPPLAVMEMYRTLKVGGQFWAEVPFMQFYHPTPGDYTRWTVDGFRLFLKDFTENAAGISVMIGHEVAKICGDVQRATRTVIPEKTRSAISDVMERYQEQGSTARLYSSVYFWGTKTEETPGPKRDYFQWLRAGYAAKASLPYTVDQRLTSAEVRGLVIPD